MNGGGREGEESARVQELLSGLRFVLSSFTTAVCLYRCAKSNSWLVYQIFIISTLLTVSPCANRRVGLMYPQASGCSEVMH
jgi:hypothetical protein